jgi:Rrf2 family protein
VISKTAEYGLRAVLHMAAARTDSLLRASDIAENLDVPANYLSKILHSLARAGILTSGRGPRGGFRLSGSPEELTLADVIRPLDPAMLEQTCLLGNPRCTESSACAVHEHWKSVREPLLAFFESRTLSDVLDGNQEYLESRPA